MSSKGKILGIALVALLAFGFYSATTKADVGGSFGLNMLYMPIDCESVAVLDANGDVVPLADQPCEKTLVKFDFEASINVNITLSGLTIGLHSHLGTTGLEDVLITFSTTLGALDIRDTFVFAQPFGAITDGTGMVNFACFENRVGSSICDLFFVKKRVEITFGIGGVRITNLAILEDVNFPECNVIPLGACVQKPQSGTYTAADQAFGFGDLIEFSGETPSGVTVTSRTGICATEGTNKVKKHYFPGVVNPDCIAGAQTPSPKPPLFFDFEKILIHGIPLATNVLMDATVFCTQPTFACNFSVALTFSGAVIFSPITLTSQFSNVTGPLTFGGLAFVLPAGNVTITVAFSPTLSFSSVTASFFATINPERNPGTITATFNLVPGTGLSSITITLSVVREGLTFSAISNFSGNPVVLSRVTFSVRAKAGLVTLTTAATYTFNPAVLGGSLGATITF